MSAWIACCKLVRRIDDCLETQSGELLNRVRQAHRTGDFLMQQTNNHPRRVRWRENPPELCRPPGRGPSSASAGTSGSAGGLFTVGGNGAPDSRSTRPLDSHITQWLYIYR